MCISMNIDRLFRQGEAYKHKLNFDHFRNIDEHVTIAAYVSYPRNFVAKSVDFYAENITWFYVRVIFTIVLIYHVYK